MGHTRAIVVSHSPLLVVVVVFQVPPWMAMRRLRTTWRTPGSWRRVIALHPWSHELPSRFARIASIACSLTSKVRRTCVCLLALCLL